MELYILFSYITVMASFFFASLLMLFKIVKRRSTINLPPGPSTLPLIGNIHQIINNSLPHHCFKKNSEKYGPLMYLKLGEVPYIIVSSPQMVKEIMKTHDLTFSDRPNLLLATILTYNNTDIAFSMYGEHWRQLRKLCVIELLSVKHVQSFRSIREEEASNLVKSMSASEGSVVNLTQKILSTTYGITARAAFGKRNIHQEAFILAMEETLRLMGGFCVVELYPSIKFLRWMSRAKTKLEKLQRELDIILQDIIDDHKRSHMEESKDEDLVDVLLKIQQESEHS